MDEHVVIVGGGPAAYTAAIYAARERLAPLVLEGFTPGGLLQETTAVENFPGHPDGIHGPDLVGRIREQARRAGARFETAEAERLEPGSGGGPHRVHAAGRAIAAGTVILATGAEPRRLGVPGEEELAGLGVAYCAVCDAPLYAGARTIVVGGGDAAVEEAVALSRHARSVALVHRRESLRASAALQARLRASPVTLELPWTVEAFLELDGALGAVRLRDVRTGAVRERAVDGAFVAIGHIPRSELAEGVLALDPGGYVRTAPGSTATSVPGIFAAGDVADPHFRQAVTAAGTGAQAALEAIAWLDRAAARAPALVGP